MNVHNLSADPPGDLRLMIPGPCELNPADLAALGQQTVPHYGESWSALFRALLQDLERLLDAEIAYAVPGTGTAGLEIALGNLFSPGDKVVVPDTGYFGQRLAEIAEALGIQVNLLPLPLDLPLDPAALDQSLVDAHGLLMVHIDSTTGIRHPIKEMARHARAANVTFVVDAIASVGGEDVRLRESGIDALVTAPQKGLGAPPGLAIVAFDEWGLEQTRRHRPRSWYFDLARWEEARLEDAWEPHPVTMPTAIIRALVCSVSRILQFGLNSWVAEREALGIRLRKQLRSAGLELNAPESCSANLITVIRTPEPSILAKRAAKRGIMIGQGLPPLTDTVRVGLLGNTAKEIWTDRVVSALADDQP